jgi:protocatechuate 3,4-dioxygenase beta subunit
MLKRFSSLAAALILMGSNCVSTHAQQPQVSAEPASEVTTGEITGSVVNERGEPMAGATVFVRTVGSLAQSRTTVSDAEGTFRFAGLEPALYSVTSVSPAYVLQPPPPDATSVYYRIGDSVRLELIRGGVLTGTVTNAAGEPIVGIRVRALRVRDAEGRQPRTPSFGIGDRPTDDRGIYRIYGLLPGTYLVFAGGSGSQQSTQLNPFETDVPTYSPSSTRDSATEYNVRGGEETTADIRYRNDPGRTVSGTVRVAGQSSANVMLFASDGNVAPVSTTFQMPGARGFALTGVGDGEYYVYAQEIPGGMPSGPIIPDLSISEIKRVSVKGADVTGIELMPRPLSVISGAVVLEPSKAPECQGKRKPLFSEMMIELQRNEKDSELMPPFQRVPSNPPSINAKGAFSMRNVVPARYRFNPRFFARYWYLQSITIGGSPAAKAAAARNDAAANWTSVRAGEQLSNVTITLAAGAASIRGKITVAEGAAVPSGAAVYLVPAERDKVNDVLRYFVTNVSSEGAFSLNNLPPGRYWPLLQTTAQPEIATLAKLRLPESLEARTRLRRIAEAQKSDVELKPCQTLADYQLPPK